MQRLVCGVAVCALIGIVAKPVQAKKNDPNVELEFNPQQYVAVAEVHLTSEMHQRPVRLKVVDGRPSPDPSNIGTRTDDDDEKFQLTATNDVLTFAERIIIRSAKEWGVVLSDDAELTLAGKLLRFHVAETNQVVGASYYGDVRLGFDLRDAVGRVLWSGTGSGDASRYGRKFSNDNCNEVLSDALLEALASTLSNSRLHEAWAGRAPAREPTAPQGPTASPETANSPSQTVSVDALLADVLALTQKGFGTDTLVEFVTPKVLDARPTAKQLIEWQEAGVPEEVVRAALNCAVR
jgi:hypothetical protein